MLDARQHFLRSVDDPLHWVSPVRVVHEPAHVVHEIGVLAGNASNPGCRLLKVPAGSNDFEHNPGQQTGSKERDLLFPVVVSLQILKAPALLVVAVFIFILLQAVGSAVTEQLAVRALQQAGRRRTTV